jgi:hypothetical protein
MASPGTCEYAGSVAKGAAQQNSQEYKVLSAKMCWDAVKHVAVLAGVIDDARANGLAHTSMIRLSDKVVAHPDAMGNLPAGHVLGFFEGERLIHAMVSIGEGKAAGNKNDCIGVGGPVGWEVLDLKGGLKWGKDGIQAPKGAGVSRAVTVHHRPITDLKTA